MRAFKRIATGLFIVFFIAGCSSVNLSKEIDSLIQTSFSSDVDEYVQLNRRFLEVSRKASNVLSGAQAQAPSGGPGFDSSMRDADELNNQLTELNKEIYNKKLDIITGILRALKEKGAIRDFKDIKLMETVNQHLLSAVKAKMRK